TRGRLIVQRVLERQTEARLVIKDKPTNQSSRRTVHLAPLTAEALTTHRRQQLQDRIRAGSAWHVSNFVFTRPDGRPLEPRSVHDAFHRGLAKAGLPRVRPHDLRHGAATLLLKAGVHPKLV